jgi:hypothetical protein
MYSIVPGKILAWDGTDWITGRGLLVVPVLSVAYLAPIARTTDL